MAISPEGLDMTVYDELLRKEKALGAYRCQYQSDPSLYCITFSDRLQDLVEASNKVERILTSSEANAKLVLRHQTVDMARRTVAEWNTLALPEVELTRRRVRARYALKYLNVASEMGAILDGDRVARHRNPEDREANERLGWSLFEMARHMLRAQRISEGASLLAEFDTILKPTLLSETLKRARIRLGSRLADLRDATKLLCDQAAMVSKQGEHARSADLYRKILCQTPQSKAAQEGLGWELARLLQANMRRDELDGKYVLGSLKEYMSLTLITKPSVLHSWMLALATRASEVLGQHYFLFVKHWDLANLRVEDYKPYTPARKDAAAEKAPVDKGQARTAGKALPCLAETVGMALGKVAKTIKRNKLLPGVDLKWAADSVGTLVTRFPKNPWLPYYHAMLLIRIGDLDAARKLLIPLVRAKIDEFWVWGALSDTYPPQSRERLTCLCRAYTCHPKDISLLSGVRRRLSDALKNAGDVGAAEMVLPPIAVIGFDKALAIGSGNVPTHAPGEEHSLIVPQEAPPERLKAEAARVHSYAKEAENLVMADVPWVPALISGIVAAKGAIKGGIFILAKQGNDRMAELKVNPRRFECLTGATLGMPLSVRVTEVEGRPMVVGIIPREGAPWDLLPTLRGVVTLNNPEKRVTMVALGMDQIALAYHDDFPSAQELTTGDVVDLRYQGSPDNRTGRLVWFARTTEPAPMHFVKPYQGNLCRHKGGFGFVGDIYLPDSLMGDKGDGVSVTGLAVMETNRKSGKKGWRAITICTK